MTPTDSPADGPGADATDVSRRHEVEPDEPADGKKSSSPLTGHQQPATHAIGVEQAKENARNDPPA